MKKTTLLIPILALTITGCSNIYSSSLLNALGVPKGIETSDYKVTGAGGVITEIKPGNPNKSTYRYSFVVDLKNAAKVKSIRIERIKNNGEKELVIDDSKNPTIKHNGWQTQEPNGARSYLYGSKLGYISWVGQSQSYKMTPDQAHWLYSGGTTREKYLFTITSLNNKTESFTQNTQILAYNKNVLLDVLYGQKQ